MFYTLWADGWRSGATAFGKSGHRMFTKPGGGIHSRTTMIKKHYGKLIPSNAKQMTSHVSEPMGFGKGLKR
ncbi:hypothetical protein EMIT093MI4_140076 [Pseudomonas sp. IT-93MI4]